VPEHLLGVFKLLHRHGHKLRDRYGPELKRHVRFADEDMSLRLEVRFPNSDKWERISPLLAREMEKLDSDREEQSLRERLSQSSYDGEIEYTPSSGANSLPLGQQRACSAPVVEDSRSQASISTPLSKWGNHAR
jgi:hypothetical protein